MKLEKYFTLLRSWLWGPAASGQDQHKSPSGLLGAGAEWVVRSKWPPGLSGGEGVVSDIRGSAAGHSDWLRWCNRNGLRQALGY